MILRAHGIPSVVTTGDHSPSSPRCVVHSSVGEKLCLSKDAQECVLIRSLTGRFLESGISWDDDDWIEDGEVGLPVSLGFHDGESVELINDVGRAQHVIVTVETDTRAGYAPEGLAGDVTAALISSKLVARDTFFRLADTTSSACVREVTGSFSPNRDYANSAKLERPRVFRVDEDTVVDIDRQPLRDGEDLRGLDDVLPQLKEFISNALKQRDLYRQLGIPPTRAVILEGTAGVGKKSVLRAACRDLNVSFVFLDLHDVSLTDGEEPSGSGNKDDSGSQPSEWEESIVVTFSKAKLLQPSLILIRGLDLLGSTSMRDSTAASAILTALDTQTNALGDSSVLVFGSTRDASNFPNHLQKQTAFSRKVALPLPKRSQRKAILQALLPKIQCFDSGKGVDGHDSQSEILDAFASELSDRTPGYVAGDLAKLTRIATFHAIKRRVAEGNTDMGTSSLQLDFRIDFQKAILATKLSTNLEGDRVTSPALWNDILGYKTLKNRVLQLVEWPLFHPDSFIQLGTEPPCGILLYGPSGCGKSMIGHALASVSRMNFKSIKGSQIFSKYLGESERIVREVFAQARRLSPCILFIDELGSIATKRDLDDPATSTSVPHRVLSTLLNELDGVGFTRTSDSSDPLASSSQSTPHVLLVAATSRKDLVDDALLRPGRIDRLLEVGLPTVDDREDILRVMFDKARKASGTAVEIAGVQAKLEVDVRVNTRRWAEELVGLSGADLSLLVRETALRTLASTEIPRRDVESVRLVFTDSMVQETIQG